MSIAETPSVVRDIVDSNEEREFWTVVRLHERPPYFFPDEGVGNRLNRAARVVTEDRITPNSDGSYTVEGSEHRQYRVAESCSCPQSQKGKSKWCYHAVAVALYVEWRKRCAPVAPVVLGTLRAGTAPLAPVHDDEALGNGSPTDDETLPLPIGPTSVEERLAQPTGTLPQPFTLHLIAQEDRMPDADDGVIPEPATAVLEPAVALTTPSTSSLDARGLLESMAAWKEQRQILARYIKEQMQDGIDFYTLRIKGRDTKPTLSKAGSEKFLAIFKLTASFQQDAATWTMLGSKEGVLCYTCTLLTREGQVVGEGRGARTLAQDQGDINKAVKMAQKSAQIDAILRTGCLSDVFTQDLDDPPEITSPAPAPARTTSADLRSRIWALVKQADPTITTRDACEAFVHARTAYVLEPDNYQAILNKLEQQR